MCCSSDPNTGHIHTQDKWETSTKGGKMEIRDFGREINKQQGKKGVLGMNGNEIPRNALNMKLKKKHLRGRP
jgi:hypothetical protein